MNEASYRELVQASWRRSLTPAEEAELQAYLAVHPEQSSEWENEAALNDFLRQIPEAPPVSSNFTALVMQRIETQERITARPASPVHWWAGWLRRLTPKLATAGVLLICSVVGVQQYNLHQQREATQTFASTFAEVTSVIPTPMVLQDFDAIQQMRVATGPTDADLLAVLEK